MRLWKVFKKGLKSTNGTINWKLGEWQKHEGELEMCKSGFHASERIINAMQYTNAEIIARVEVRGDHLKQEDKQVWSEMRIVKTYNCSKEDSVNLAIFAAELVIDNFEKEYPKDDRPRKAIETAKEWLENKNDSAARSAELAASAAKSAESAAWSAASSARSATSAAKSAAWSAAWSAESAASTAWSAESAAWPAASAASAAKSAAKSAAWSAAKSAVSDNCERFILKRIKGGLK